jgi:hypothetical protein
MIVLRIDGAPPRNFVSAPAALAHVPPTESRHQLLASIGPLRSGGGENANVSCTLDNRAGEASALLVSRPPIGVAATITAGGIEQFAGVVQRITLSAAGATLEVEA